MTDKAAEVDFDLRYLLFLERTEAVFAQFPQLELIRPFLFKGLLMERRGTGLLVNVKRRLRPWLKRDSSNPPPARSDVLVWMELARETLTGELLPVRDELARRSLGVATAWYQGPTRLPPGVVRFGFTPRGSVPRWWRPAWEALVEAEPGLAGSRSLVRSFQDSVAAMAGLLDEMERLFDLVRPRVVVCAATNVPGGAALALLARRRGIPSLMLQHGYWQPMHLPIIADVVGSWGPLFREWLVEHGVPAERVLALGSPRHDGMARASGTSRPTFLRALGLPDRPTFVFFSCGNELSRNQDLPGRCVQWLARAAGGFGDRVNFVVRLHPNEDGALYKGCGGLHVYKNQPDLEMTLDACDWSGSLCSTTMFEALLYRKPVWQFLGEGWRDLSGIASRGLAERVASQDDLLERLADFCDRPPKPDADDSASVRAFANHGKAAGVVADWLEQALAAPASGRASCGNS